MPLTNFAAQVAKASPQTLITQAQIPGAVVEVVDTMPPELNPTQAWWKNPLLIGIAVLGGVLVLSSLFRRD